MFDQSNFPRISIILSDSLQISLFNIYIYIYIWYKKVKLETIDDGYPKAPFSIATTQRCRDGRNSFPRYIYIYIYRERERERERERKRDTLVVFFNICLISWCLSANTSFMLSLYANHRAKKLFLSNNCRIKMAWNQWSQIITQDIW